VEDPADSRLIRTLKRLMAEARIGQKKLAQKAGLNDTYVRDILSGRSRNPGAGRLSKVAEALQVDVSVLLDAAKAGAGEDPRERLLLSTWRRLPEDAKAQTLDFVAFHLERARKARLTARPRKARTPARK
jgi:transcriptional regulator with XRE-family HTH domain